MIKDKSIILTLVLMISISFEYISLNVSIISRKYFTLTIDMLPLVCCRVKLYLTLYYNLQPIEIICSSQFFCCLHKILNLKKNVFLEVAVWVGRSQMTTPQSRVDKVSSTSYMIFFKQESSLFDCVPHPHE